MNHSDHEQRRLVERLSGWRLKAFFAGLVLNLFLTLILNQWVLVLSSSMQALVFGLIGAQVAICSFVTGCFRFSILTKVALLFSFVILATWTTSRITELGFASLEVSLQFTIFVTQSMLLCLVASLWGRWRIGVRELLIVTTLLALTITMAQWLLPNWESIWATQMLLLVKMVAIGIVNSMWFLVTVYFVVTGLTPIKYLEREWTIKFSLLGSLILLGATFDSGIELLSGWQNSAGYRMVFVGFALLNLVPVIGLSARRNKVWVKTLDFYRGIQRRAA